VHYNSQTADYSKVKIRSEIYQNAITVMIQYNYK